MFNDIRKIVKNTLNNKNKGITIGSIIKFTILAIVAMFAVSILLTVFKWTFGITGNLLEQGGVSKLNIENILEQPEMVVDYADSVIQGKMMAPSIGVDIIPVPSLGLASKDAEDYETREYSASYEKRNIDKICTEFEALKPLQYVVFINANRSESYCGYNFKVEVEKEQEIISMIESLNPKDFNANTYTIERNITNSNNEIEILEKKLEMLDSLLENAQTKYAALRNTGDANALVQAVNNEINLIERITNQKLNVQAQIDRLTNNKGSQEERIDYSQFNISISERKLIDLSSISADWRYAFERFVASISTALQDLTIGLIEFLFKLIKFVLYIGIGVITLTITAKILWRFVRRIWSNH
jgi:hypothetical protein